MVYNDSCCDGWKRSAQSFYDWAFENGFTEDAKLTRTYSRQLHSPCNSYFVHKDKYFSTRPGSISVVLEDDPMTLADAHRLVSPPEISYQLVRSRYSRLKWNLTEALTTLPGKVGRKRKKVKS